MSQTDRGVSRSAFTQKYNLRVFNKQGLATTQVWIGSSTTKRSRILGRSFVDYLTAKQKDSLTREKKARIKVINMGRSGTSSYDWISDKSTVRKVVSRRPDLVGIQLGGNDYAQGVSPEEFGRNISELIREIRENVPSALFVLLGVHRRLDVASPQFSWVDYIEEMRRVCRTFPGVATYIDASELGIDFSNIAADRVHLTNLGARRLASMVFTSLYSAR